MDFKFSNSDDARTVLAHIGEILDEFGYVTLADVRDLMGDETKYEDLYVGWTSINDSYLLSSETECALILPHPKRLKKNEGVRKMNKEPNVDMVAHPPHYQSKAGIEVINVIEAFTADLKGIEATDTGNIIKYICRWPHKNGLEDLNKARWYLDHLIDHVEKSKKENGEL